LRDFLNIAVIWFWAFGAWSIYHATAKMHVIAGMISFGFGFVVLVLNAMLQALRVIVAVERP
jgi:hypothetical protein